MQLLENCPSLEDDYPPSLKKGASAPFFFAWSLISDGKFLYPTAVTYQRLGKKKGAEAPFFRLGG